MCDLLEGRDADLSLLYPQGWKQCLAQGRPAVSSADRWMNEGVNDVTCQSPQALQDYTLVGFLPRSDGAQKWARTGRRGLPSLDLICEPLDTMV